MAFIGALFLGSPIPILMTGSPFSRNIRACSLSAMVGDAVIDLASWLIVICLFVSKYFSLPLAFCCLFQGRINNYLLDVLSM
jgi:hypothetical protein